RDAARVPALLARQPPELRHSRLEVAGAHADREPAVAVVDHARERARAVAAEQDGRVGLLHRLRPRPEGREAHEVALERRLVLGPDALHGEHALAQHAPALLEVGAVVLHLLGVPPAADAEEDAPAREEVQAGDLLGGGDRVALDEQADPRADLERGGHGGRCRQRDEQVVRAPVLLRQGRAAGPRASPRDRDVGVLREPERLEAAGLDRARQVVDPHRVVGGEHDDAEVHASRYRRAPRRVKRHVRSRAAGVGSSVHGQPRPRRDLGLPRRHQALGRERVPLGPSPRVGDHAAAGTGALSHIDLYLTSGPLDDLEAGVYHFGPHDFALRRLRAGDHRAAVVAATAGEPAIATAPVIVACTSTFWRNAWKYQARTYRHCFWDDGTLLANLAVAAAVDLPARV